MIAELAIKMQALADSGHPRADELHAKAVEFDEKTRRALDGAENTTKSMLGAWARARRLWCDCTGEALV